MKKFLFITAVVGLMIISGCSKTENLFNGKDLSNWNFVVDGNSVPAEQVFFVQDGLIKIAGKPFGYMYTKEKYGNYTLEVEWSWPGEAANSGIFLLIAEPKNPFPNGIECQLKAGDAGSFVLLGGSDLAEYKQEGAERPKFPVVKKREESSEKPVGEWNKAKIDVQDGVINVYVNGVHQNTGTNTVKEGYIGLQSEGGPIQFRSVKITRK